MFFRKPIESRVHSTKSLGGVQLPHHTHHTPPTNNPLLLLPHSPSFISPLSIDISSSRSTTFIPLVVTADSAQNLPSWVTLIWTSWRSTPSVFSRYVVPRLPRRSFRCNWGNSPPISIQDQLHCRGLCTGQAADEISQVDATSKANSGHPGAPMGMAPVSHVLFNKFMNFNPKNPDWVNRDRFVLSYVSCSDAPRFSGPHSTLAPRRIFMARNTSPDSDDRIGTATAACCSMPCCTCSATSSPWMT